MYQKSNFDQQKGLQGPMLDINWTSAPWVLVSPTGDPVGDMYKPKSHVILKSGVRE